MDTFLDLSDIFWIFFDILNWWIRKNNEVDMLSPQTRLPLRKVINLFFVHPSRIFFHKAASSVWLSFSFWWFLCSAQPNYLSFKDITQLAIKLITFSWLLSLPVFTYSIILTLTTSFRSSVKLTEISLGNPDEKNLHAISFWCPWSVFSY